ncbi:MFS transporter [Blastococcus sp. Marseille-P5729]|uniref:MFS transporter n=1 Tax=Blastococcus sp. Marseille-P5729 TaxID=2086582 RepID=UPI000D0F7D9F|nr:MFS transporter [Blastococcus sp. Marseille-P5729]
MMHLSRSRRSIRESYPEQAGRTTTGPSPPRSTPTTEIASEAQVLTSYAELFRTPGTRAFSATGFIARMPISQLGLASLLLVSAQTGSYGLAGKVSATAALAGAIVMPQTARLVDRYGQARVARPIILAGAVGWLLLALAVTEAWPTWTWFVLAAIGGGLGPSIGAMVRARWVHVLGSGHLQRRAFSWESAVDEIVFIVGPPLATFLATGLAPWAGVVVATALLIIGGWLFTGQTGTEPPPGGKDAPRFPSRLLLTPTFVAVALVFTCCGVAFGAIDVIVVAFAEEAGSKGVAGLILAAYAAGSLIAGLGFGIISFKRSVGAQFVVAASMFGLLAPLLLLASNLWLCTILIFIAGFAIAPLLISATVLIERIVPPAALTEALTWSTTSLIGGVTIGGAGGGSLVDRYGAQLSFWLPAGVAILAAAIAIVSIPRLRFRSVQRTASRLAASLVDAPAPGVPQAELPS